MPCEPPEPRSQSPRATLPRTPIAGASPKPRPASAGSMRWSTTPASPSTCRTTPTSTACRKEDFLHLYAVNTVGPFQMLRACRPLLEAAERPSVLMTSSIAAVTGGGSSVAYAASKGALNTMVLSLARALAPKIRVNAICPGFMDTRWFSSVFGEEKAARVRENVAKSVPLQVAAKPEDIADAALFFISDAARHITGETLLIDGGSHLGLAPTRAR